MAANGSMPAVNIAGVNTRGGRLAQQQQQQQQQQGDSHGSPMASAADRRRVRIASRRSLSSENDLLDSWASCLDASGTAAEQQEQPPPKHKRTRLAQVQL